MPKSTPIIFKAKMVKAILDGRKTQTRRVIKQQPVTKDAHVVIKKNKLMIYERAGKQPGSFDVTGIFNFPLLYGQKGDHLWVREAIRKRELAQGYIGATYLADQTAVIGRGSKGSYCGRAICDWYWKRDTLPGIFMPRWASRITLGITEVKVEMVQQISYADIRAESIEKELNDTSLQMKQKFIDLWDSINAKRGYSWESNPWVWAITFEILEENNADSITKSS